MTLVQIQDAVRLRAEAINSTRPDWPCRKGCDDCCRSLASLPRVSAAEWRRIERALDEPARQRIRASASATRPVVCPLLDTGSGACRIYDVRPVACRAYGFYAERQYVLGCHRIEAIGHEQPDVVWGNHVTLEGDLAQLGPVAELHDFLDHPSQFLDA